MHNFVLRSILRCWRPYLTQCARHHTEIVLGIETSCDETGAAVVTENGEILGEGIHSQLNVHLLNGGVIPHLAKYYHSENIHQVVTSALNQSGYTLKDLSAIAVTTKPGLSASLAVGLEYAKHLINETKKPLIPIHHMEAHALTVRLVDDIKFPFLVLLASGGHCQLAYVKNVEEFLLLGTSQHNSPGETIDKIARRLKLQNLPECCNMSGGRAIEHIAQGGNYQAYNFPSSMLAYRDCNFSFSGYGSYAAVTIEEEEKYYGVPPDGVIPTVRDFCASLQHGVTQHLLQRVARAVVFCEERNLFPENDKVLAFSGGVACNNFIRGVLKDYCATVGFRLACPPPKLCTDNGIMIAWNGLERLRENVGITFDPETVVIQPTCPLGKDITEEVKKANIKIKYNKIINTEVAREASEN